MRMLENFEHNRKKRLVQLARAVAPVIRDLRLHSKKNYSEFRCQRPISMPQLVGP